MVAILFKDCLSKPKTLEVAVFSLNLTHLNFLTVLYYFGLWLQNGKKMLMY